MKGMFVLLSYAMSIMGKNYIYMYLSAKNIYLTVSLQQNAAMQFTFMNISGVIVRPNRIVPFGCPLTGA